ncbi:hypothetical protein D3C84_909170 [compost metagenome]
MAGIDAFREGEESESSYARCSLFLQQGAASYNGRMGDNMIGVAANAMLRVSDHNVRSDLLDMTANPRGQLIFVHCVQLAVWQIPYRHAGQAENLLYPCHFAEPDRAHFLDAQI